MPSKYLTSPLLIIVIIGLVSIFGLGTTKTFSSANIGLGLSPSQQAQTIYYDYSGIAKVYANGTAIHEQGQFEAIGQVVGNNYGVPVYNSLNANAGWNNNTYNYLGVAIIFPLYLDTQHKNPLSYSLAENPSQSSGLLSGNYNNTVSPTNDIAAMLIIISALVGVGSVIGVHFLGSGESDSVLAMILKFTGFLAIWGVFSALSYNILNIIPLSLGLWFYFVLTLCYVIGLVDTIGHPSQ